MRTFHAADRTRLRIEWIRGRDAYEGMLEGTPYLARKFRLMRGRTAMQSPGVLVLGLDELEAEIAGLDPRTDIWAPHEEWVVRLVSDTDWDAKTRRYLVLMWFQDGGDPFERLAAAVERLDFSKVSKLEAVDVD